MAKYKTLKENARHQAELAKMYQDRALTTRIKLAALEDRVLELEDELEQMTMERNAARAAEGDAHRRNIMLKRELKHPPASKIILVNRRLQNEVNHLRRLVNTRRR